MAGVIIKPKNASVNAIINNIKQAGYAPLRRLMDAAITAKNSGGGNNWTAVAVSLGETNTDGTPNAVNGQAVFENLDAVLGGMTSANDSASPMDGV